MNLSQISRPLTLAAALCCVGSACFASEATSTESAPPAEAPKATPKAEAPKRALKEGMTAAEVIKLIGKPAEVASIAGQEGKAEVWIYRRLKDTQTEQVHMGDRQVTENFTDAGGRVLTNVVATETITKLRRRDTYDVLQVLLVEGKYVNMKRTVEKKDTYD